MRPAETAHSPAPLRWATWLISVAPAQAAAAIVPLALSSAYAGRTGHFYRGGREIEAPPYTRSAEVARRLWAASAALTKLTERGAPGRRPYPALVGAGSEGSGDAEAPPVTGGAGPDAA